MRAASVTIVGGGFTGASVAIQLLRAARAPLAIRIVEPGPRLGEGLAFSSPHRDHRLNGPASSHSVLPDDLQHLVRWCHRTGLPLSDPESVSGDALFIRRADFARYVRDTLDEAVRAAVPGASVRQVADEALRVVRHAGRYGVATAASGELDADMLVLATGNPCRALPRALHMLRGERALVADPYDLAALQAIPAAARVLVVGTGLTAMDVVCTLMRQGHAGPVTLASRRALQPRPHPRRYVAPGAGHGGEDQAPAYTKDGEPSVRRWLSGLRLAVDAAARDGLEWHGPFDELRDAVWKLWPRLPRQERMRFHRHLRAWYDAHRFRIPAPTEAIVGDAVARGQLAIERGRVAAAFVREGQVLVTIGDRPPLCVDVVVNATGFDLDTMSPLLRTAVDDGLLAPAEVPPGVDVDAECRALDAGGAAQPLLRVFGPPTAGRFGDLLGTAFIRAHIARAVPGMLELLAAAPGEAGRG